RPDPVVGRPEISACWSLTGVDEGAGVAPGSTAGATPGGDGAGVPGSGVDGVGDGAGVAGVVGTGVGSGWTTMTTRGSVVVEISPSGPIAVTVALVTISPRARSLSITV